MMRRLSLEERRQIFHELVTAQDILHDVPRSRKLVSEKYRISEAQLREIEDEGIEEQWPPLEEE
ncbi:MAG: hypothetical protein C4297_03530 [Gemmataceae bacterium]